MLCQEWLMSWRSLLSLSSEDLMPSKKKAAPITQDPLVLESAHPESLIGLPDSLVSNPFKNQSILKEAGHEPIDWLGIGERNATISNDLLHWQWERISHVTSQ